MFSSLRFADFRETGPGASVVQRPRRIGLWSNPIRAFAVQGHSQDRQGKAGQSSLSLRITAQHWACRANLPSRRKCTPVLVGVTASQSMTDGRLLQKPQTRTRHAYGPFGSALIAIVEALAFIQFCPTGHLSQRSSNGHFVRQFWRRSSGRILSPGHSSQRSSDGLSICPGEAQ